MDRRFAKPTSLERDCLPCMSLDMDEREPDAVRTSSTPTSWASRTVGNASLTLAANPIASCEGWVSAKSTEVCKFKFKSIQFKFRFSNSNFQIQTWNRPRASWQGLFSAKSAFYFRFKLILPYFQSLSVRVELNFNLCTATPCLRG